MSSQIALVAVEGQYAYPEDLPAGVIFSIRIPKSMFPNHEHAFFIIK